MMSVTSSTTPEMVLISCCTPWILTRVKALTRAKLDDGLFADAPVAVAAEARIDVRPRRQPPHPAGRRVGAEALQVVRRLGRIVLQVLANLGRGVAVALRPFAAVRWAL